MSSIFETFAINESDGSAQCDPETMQNVARANIYQVFARALSAPAEMDPVYPQLCRDVFETQDNALRTPALETADLWEASLKDPEQLAVAYTRLFLGPFEILASPYASFYMEPNKRIMGETSQAVAQAYAEAGLEPASGPRDAPDHITHELEFMYFLAFQEITTGEEIWRKRQLKFWTTHLRCWLPDLIQHILSADVHRYYNALANTLKVFAESENVIFSA